MNKVILGAAVAAAMLAAVPAKAVTFTVSDAFGTGNFGTATAVDLGAQSGSTDTVEVTFQMSPNLILDTGSHFAATFSLIGTGRVDGTTIDALNGGDPPDYFETNTHQTTLSNEYSNSPFGKFTDAISGNCGSGSSSGGCGTKLVFDIINFQGFAAASSLYGTPGVSIYAAVDMFKNGCTGDGCTGVVGLTAPLVPTPFSTTPLPAAIWMFGSGMGGIGLLFARRRKQAPARMI